MSATPTASPSRKFGTFLGVYTPSVLTILGLIMYLRFGWVVGNLGLGLTLVVVVLSSAITLATALSASAVATNMRVGAGGEYYLISHSLGLELGGAIGIPLFLCRTLSITFYSYGFSESMIGLWASRGVEPPWWAEQALTVALIVGITAIAGRSAETALKLQIPILVLVGLSVVALAWGVFTGPVRQPLWTPTYDTAEGGFWQVFAVFFPAVTGFAAGIAMSGDLRDPRKSIPRGVLWAVATGAAVYLLVPVLLAISGRLTLEQLQTPGVAVWTSIALFGPILVYPGIWGAILSSALGSVLGAPRVLQALAVDGLAPRFLARLSPTGQPAVATWISGAIAVAAVALGGLNAVATLVTVLFLTLYVVINLAAGIEQLTGDPSYRPTIHVPWWVSIGGAVAATAVMFLISPLACLAAAVLELGLYVWLRRRSMEKRWGDVRAGFWLAIARHALVKLRGYEADARNWRPHIFVFVADAKRQIGLVRLASWFNQDRGVLTACRLLEGNLDDPPDLRAAEQELDDELKAADLVAFGEANVVNDFEHGAISVVQANGIAGLHSNTVMFGFPRDPTRLAAQLRILRTLERLGKSGLVARLAWGSEPGRTKRIDLWWGGLHNNGDMMLLFAYLLSLNQEWDDARIVVRSIVRTAEDETRMTRVLADLIPAARIRATAEIVMRQPGERVAEVIHRRSADADLVLLGLVYPEPDKELEYAERLFELARGLRTTIFVRNGSEFAGTLI